VSVVLLLVMDKIRPYRVGAYVGDSGFSVRPDRDWKQENKS
jgi:hypothetical protein